MNKHSKETSNSWWTPIDKLMFWKAGTWIKYNTKCYYNLKLRVHFDQLFIIDDNKIFDTINMNSKLKGIFKGEVLILIVSNGQEIRKLKFQIKDNSAYYYKLLGKHFPVASHKTTASNSNTTSYKNIEDVFKKALEDQVANDITVQLPSNYEDFVKLCLLDPMFPRVVHQTQKIIQSTMKINNI